MNVHVNMHHFFESLQTKNANRNILLRNKAQFYYYVNTST